MPENPSARTNPERSCAQKQDEPGKSEASPKLPRGAKTICIPVEPGSYPEAVRERKRFRRLVDEAYARHPELFPVGMGKGYKLHDMQVSAKLDVCVRRIKLAATGEVYGIHPSFVMPYMWSGIRLLWSMRCFWRALAYRFGPRPMSSDATTCIGTGSAQPWDATVSWARR